MKAVRCTYAEVVCERSLLQLRSDTGALILSSALSPGQDIRRPSRFRGARIAESGDCVCGTNHFWLVPRYTHQPAPPSMT
ncbi:hypothetical protein Q7C36_000570 [Tachysurus vachellii]|uniref:Uncharacterized protein n=1 Tax=Tachysurus vachellii TaxID=175792 RepID=A0AA88TAL6_TACVA|nr:hypothetical protein Q7C36_000570 [Tachysurus vachellii]